MTRKSYAIVTGRDEEQEIKFYETAVKGSVPVEHDIPLHDEKTQVVGLSRHEVQKDKVIARYRAEDKPKRGQRFSMEEFADMIAEKIVERQSTER